MIEYALSVNGLTKKYPEFLLENITFDVPKGTIVGLIGENGAGKSTTLKMILGLLPKDGGSITLLGKRENEIDFDVRSQVGVVFDDKNFPERFTLRELNGLMKTMYPRWNQEQFFSCLQKLSLPANKKISTFSRGMKMKLAILAAFSQQAKLLILDEPTSGLDPVVRDDILDMFLEFVQEESHSILLSSHITSDLEKIADYIVFIHQGTIRFVKAKDELKYHYGIIRCGEAQFHAIDPKERLAYRQQAYEWEILVEDREQAKKNYPNTVVDPASIDEIMLLYAKGESR